jgi:hypothetical protein
MQLEIALLVCHVQPISLLPGISLLSPRRGVATLVVRLCYGSYIHAISYRKFDNQQTQICAIDATRIRNDRAVAFLRQLHCRITMLHECVVAYMCGKVALWLMRLPVWAR